MPTATTLALFALATFALTVSPGPGVLYVAARTLSQGRAAGFASMFGIESGEVVWLAATATGLAALLATSAAALGVLRWAGAAYLVFLGVRRLLTRGAEEALDGQTPHSLRRTYTQGVIVNLLNPKTIVFIFAFIPQFVDVEQGHVGVQILVLGLTFATLGLMSDSLYALAAGTVADRLRDSPAVARFERWFGGSILIGLGVAAALVGPHRSG